MSIIFKGRTKQDRLDIMPDVCLSFEDDRAEEYFITAGFATPCSDDPVVVYPVGSVTVDLSTVSAATGALVMES